MAYAGSSTLDELCSQVPSQISVSVAAVSRAPEPNALYLNSAFQTFWTMVISKELTITPSSSTLPPTCTHP